MRRQLPQVAANDVKRALLSTRGALFESFAIDVRAACTGYAALERNERSPDCVTLARNVTAWSIWPTATLWDYEPYLPGSQDNIKPLGLDRI